MQDPSRAEQFAQELNQWNFSGGVHQVDQLDQLKSGGRTIGVISHVSEMKDRFPDRIFVSRDPEGPSQIHQG